MPYVFGDWTVEPGRNRLTRGEAEARLEPQNMDLLEFLLEHGGETVSVEQILDAVWSQRVVEPSAVARGINQIRHALGDDPRAPTYIETIRRRGYRAVARVQRIDAAATGDGLADRSGEPERRGGRARPSRLPARAVVAALVVSAIASILVALTWHGGGPAEAERSLAVLPFENLSGDAAQEPLVDGLTAELVSILASRDDVRVVSTTSSFAYKNRRIPVTEIASALGVTHLLEGNVRRVGDRIRINAQLIDAGSDSTLWSSTYERQVAPETIVAVQRDIALNVADSLRSELAPSRPSAAADAPKTTLAALNHYYDGLFLLRKLEVSGSEPDRTFLRAIDYFESAIAADPDWAQPRAALGRVYHFWGDSRAKLHLSEQNLLDAIRLDASYGPAYGSLGYVRTVQGRYQAAMRNLDRARALGQRSAWARAILMMHLARYDEAVAEFRDAVAYDPLSLPVRAQLLNASYCAGLYDEVIAGSEAFLSENPDDVRMLAWLADAYVRSGRTSEGLRRADAAAQRLGHSAAFGPTYALAGRKEQARAAIASLREPDVTELVAMVAPTAVLLDDPEEALDTLERAVRQALADPQDLTLRFRLVHDLRCTPEIRALAGRPRYDAVLERLGLNSR